MSGLQFSIRRWLLSEGGGVHPAVAFLRVTAGASLDNAPEKTKKARARVHGLSFLWGLGALAYFFTENGTETQRLHRRSRRVPPIAGVPPRQGVKAISSSDANCEGIAGHRPFRQ